MGNYIYFQTGFSSLNNQTHPKVATFTKEVTEGYSAALTCIVSDQDNDPNDQKWRTDEDTYIVGGNHPGACVDSDCAILSGTWGQY